MWRLAAAAIAVAAAAAVPARASETFRFGRFGAVTLERPAGAPRGVMLFMAGGTPSDTAVAAQMRARGLAVARFDATGFVAALDRSRHPCLAPSPDLVPLSQEIDHRLGLDRYVEPALAGTGTGATVTYATLAQASAGLYRGGFSIGTPAVLPGLKHWCPIGGLRAVRSLGGPRALPGPLAAPWALVAGGNRGEGFAAGVPGAITAMRVVQALDRLPQAAVDGGAGLPLSLVVDRHAPPSRLMAVFYSGDGGWVGIDRSISARLAAAGIPVVGVSSLRYYWREHPPAEGARDLARVIDAYGRAWHRPRVLLIGYSFGAGALPATVEALPAATKRRIARLSLMGLPADAEFAFHLSDWLDVGGGARPTVPAIERLAKSIEVQCLRGRSEADSACPSIAPGRARQVALPGGHHFGGDDAAVARALLDGLKLT